MNRKIPVWLLILIIYIGINFTIVFGWSVKHVQEGGGRLGRYGPILTTIASFPTLSINALYEVGLLKYKKGDDEQTNLRRPPQLLRNRFPNIDGFKKNGVIQAGAIKDNGYLLLSAYNYMKNQATVKLVQIKNQKILHEWVPNIQELAQLHRKKFKFTSESDFKPTRYRIGHPLLLSDGGLIFHNLEGPLYKISACSDIEWSIDEHFHHAIEAEVNSDFWVGAVIEPTSYENEFFPDYRDDAIAKISSSGKVKFKKSVSSILDENGYRGILFGFGPYSSDPIHLNDIQPAYYSTNHWDKGDILVSLRHRSTVFLYRPSTNKILWLKTGPWLNQHDADFIGQSRISIYGNNIVIAANNKEHLIDGFNNVYIYDFTDGSISTPYSNVMKDTEVQTRSEGSHEILENADVFIEETMEGRLLRVSPKQVVWEFTEKVDNNSLSLVSWSRYLTLDQVEKIVPILENSNCL